MAGKVHEQLIDRLCADGWMRNDWRKALRTAAASREEWRDEMTMFEEDLRLVWRYADAARIVIESDRTKWNYPVLVVELMEVEVSNPITPAKREQYIDLWWLFDGTSHFALRVFTMDKHGNVRPYITEDNIQQVMAGM